MWTFFHIFQDLLLSDLRFNLPLEDLLLSDLRFHLPLVTPEVGSY